MKTAALTHIGFVKKQNEDRHLIKQHDDGSILMAVADGMGGEVAGGFAAEIVMNTIAHEPITSEKSDEQLRGLLKNADLAVYDAARRDTELRGMGSTLTCAFMQEGILNWVHVGDSRLFVLKNRNLIQVTTDQTMAQFLLDEGEISEAEARRHPSRNHLDQCIGCGDCIPDSGELKVEPGNQIMLSTDGLHGEIPYETIYSILSTPTDIEVKADSLINAALKEGGKDNITVLIAEI